MSAEPQCTLAKPVRDPWAPIVVLAAVFAVQAFLIHEIYSLDVWWQTTVGADILGHWEVPSVDRYSVAGQGRPYHDSHWLFQVLLALAHAGLGMIGVELVMVALWGLALTLVYRSCRQWVSPQGAAVLCFLAAMASAERFLPRPELVTFLGTALFYHLLQKGRFRSPWDLLLLALVQVAWANGHGLFVLGPFLVGCYWLAAATTALRARGAAPVPAPSELRALTIALAVVVVATFATPFPLGGWRYAMTLITEASGGGPVVMASLGELSATFGGKARSAPAFWFFLTLLTASAVLAIRALARRRVSPRLLILAGLAATALTGRRNIVLFALVAAPFLAEELAAWAGRLRYRPGWVSGATALLLVVWGLYPLSGAYYLQMEIPARWGFGVTPSFFPHGLPAFLDRIGFEGRVINSNTLGGFYLYHGYPQRLPLTDGRWEVYDPEILERILTLSRSRHGGWQTLVDEYEIGGILLAHTSPEARSLLPELRQTSGWRLVYLDRAASFWRPDGPGTPPAVSLDDPASLPLLQRPDDGWILNAFLGGIGAREAQRINLERTLAFGWRRAELLEQLGPLQLAAGRIAAAQDSFEALLELDPENTGALNELAFLAYRRGDFNRAVLLLERAVELAPDDLRLRENLGRLHAARQRPPQPPPGGDR